MEEKRRILKEMLWEYARQDVCLAFSGGIDSSLLLRLCRDAAAEQGTRLYAVTFDTVLHPPVDRETAQRVATENNVIHEILEINELEQDEIRYNPTNRCYLCKRTLFSKLLVFAREKGIAHVLEGTNHDDLSQYRPGLQAVRELGIKSPLLEAGLTKSEIRSWAKELGISVAERPSTPCLATRLPYGAQIDIELLKLIGEAEAALRALGFWNVRVRVHGDILRLELDKEAFAKALACQTELETILRPVGPRYLTLDLEGFRSGSMDTPLK